ncbi:MAG: DUF4251 domain-containing protein [Niabella sp.]
MKRYIIIFMAFAITITGCSSQKASVQSTPLASKIEEQRYTFNAQSVFPTEDSRFNPRLMFPNSSSLYQLGTGYDLKVTPDSVIAYLPFFGRAYTAPMNPTEGGIKFTSTKFDYKKAIRKGNYEIQISPRDNKDVNSLLLVVSPGGYASLRVTSNNRTPISFNGRIEE